MLDQLAAVRNELYRLAGTKTEPYTPPVDAVYPPIGVELNTVPDRVGTLDTPARFNDSKP